MQVTTEKGSGRKILVAIFFWRALDLEGGASLVSGVVNALEKQGHEVSLLLPTRSDNIPGHIPVTTYLGRSGLSTLRRYLQRLRRASANVDAVIVLENNPTFHLLMSRFLARTTPTAIHISSPTVGIEILSLGLRRQYLSHWLGKSRFAARIFGYLLGFRFPLYVVSTEYQKDELRSLGCPPEKVQVVPFGVDPTVFEPSGRVEHTTGLIVGYVGHFSPIKGVADLVAAFNSLAVSRPTLELRLAWSGKGADAPATMRQIESSPRRAGIQLMGRVDVAEFMRQVDVIVLPFRSGSIPHLPLVLLEAFAMGVPVITTRVGGLVEAVRDGETGYTVRPRRPSELARAIARFDDDPELWNSLRATILARAPQRYSTERLCEVLTSCLLGNEGAERISTPIE